MILISVSPYQLIMLLDDVLEVKASLFLFLVIRPIRNLMMHEYCVVETRFCLFVI